MPGSASEAGAGRPGGAWPWAVLLALTCAGVYLAWAGPQGRLASTPWLLAAGLAVTVATVFHQAAALLAAAGCGALLLSERGPWRRRLLRSAAFGAGIAAAVLLAYVTMGAALGFRSPTALWGWMTTYLETQHSLQFRFPESLAQTVMGLVRTGVQVERLEWSLARHLPFTAILYLYIALGGVSALVAALFASRPLMRARLRALWPDEPLFVVSVLSVLVWGAFCVGWEPITYYWMVALFPGLVALGLLLRGRLLAIRVLLAASVALAAWNVRFNHDWDRIYARNFPEPLADAIEAQLGPGDLMVVLGNRDWFGNMDYDLLFRLLEHRGETRNVAILNDLVMNKAAERPWAEALRGRIERSLDAGARVFVASHVLDPAQYVDLTDAGSAFAAYAKEQYAGLDGPTLHRQVEQVFSHYGLVP